jgi:Tol biopolymer transport system component
MSTRDGADLELYVMDADGSDLVRLTDNDVSDEGPAWSPDGRPIAFTLPLQLGGALLRPDARAVPPPWPAQGRGLRQPRGAMNSA